MAAERNGIGAVGTMVNILKYHPKTIRNIYRFGRFKFDLKFSTSLKRQLFMEEKNKLKYS